jgi:hypothetical protein
LRSSAFVSDAKYRSLREPFQPILYQLPIPGQSFIVHLRSRAAPESVVGPMRKVLAGIDPRLSYVEVTTLESEIAASRISTLYEAEPHDSTAPLSAAVVAFAVTAIAAFIPSLRDSNRSGLGSPRTIKEQFAVSTY